MLERMDRVVMAAADAAAVGAVWERFLDARADGGEAVPALSAETRRWRVGNGWLEVLEPDGSGAGPVASAVAARGDHLFAGGFTTADPAALAQHLDANQVPTVGDGERVWVDGSAVGVPGLRLVVGPDQPQPTVGLVDHFYEISLVTGDAATAVERVATLFGLDSSAFVPIESSHYGYAGTLTLLDPDRLDRLEIITPTVAGTTMQRWFERTGGGFYMAFAESGQLGAIEERALAAGAGVTAEPSGDRRDDRGAHTVFLHPATLGGMMLGTSRPDHAWTWSGHPERAEAGR